MGREWSLVDCQKGDTRSVRPEADAATVGKGSELAVPKVSSGWSVDHSMPVSLEHLLKPIAA
jgi:hypothetical protein